MVALVVGERRRRNVPCGAWRAGRVVRVEEEEEEGERGVKERRMRVWEEESGGGVNEVVRGVGWRVRWARGRGGEGGEVKGR